MVITPAAYVPVPSNVFTRAETLSPLKVALPAFSVTVKSPNVFDFTVDDTPFGVIGKVNVSGAGAGAPKTFPPSVTVIAAVNAVLSNFTSIAAAPVEPNVVFVQVPAE